MVWNPLLLCHLHLRGICKKFSIHFLGIEGGIVPGTVEIDRHGHLVNTTITIDSKSFDKKTLSADDLNVTRDYLLDVKINNYSKKHQPVNSTLPANLNKPIIFLAGIDERAVASNSVHYSRRKVFSPYRTYGTRYWGRG